MPPQIFFKGDQCLTKFIAVGGCMIYLFAIDAILMKLINEEAMWPTK